jgi:SAM-dependent methyltransferase
VDRDEVIRRRDELVRRDGPWRNDNIRLAPGVFTISERPHGHEWRVAQFVQIVSDAVGGSLSGLRVLDLGAGEGMFSAELAAHGADVLAIEARAPSVAKIELARDALGLPNLRVVQGDVRELSRERHGEFDVVLCLGILYHLDADGVFLLTRRMAEVCRRFALVDTHFGLRDRTEVRDDGRSYSGVTYREHDPGSSSAAREAELRASIDNPESFWPTRPSLYNLLADVGFSSVHETRIPRYAGPGDRTVMLAFKGEPVELRTVTRTPAALGLRWHEHRRNPPTRFQRSWGYRTAQRLVPEFLRAARRRSA